MIAAERTASAKDIAATAGRAALLLSQHLSRLVGDTGIKSLAYRSIMVAARTFPWLANIERATDVDPCIAMRSLMEHQSPDVAIDAFVHVWSTFVGLLGKLIGAQLVDSLLHEIWPTQLPALREEAS